MQITDVRIRLAEGGDERLCAYSTITIDGQFVVRDLRIIAGDRGLFVAMPSRKTMHRCPGCGHKNAAQSRFCNECARQLRFRKPPANDQSRMHVDIAHPITAECRRMIQDAVLAAYDEERRLFEEYQNSGAERPRERVEEREEDFDLA